MNEIGLASTTAAITPIEYGGLQAAYDHFNGELFGGRLPNLFITYQRQSRTRGYYSHQRFSERADEHFHSEIALNPIPSRGGPTAKSAPRSSTRWFTLGSTPSGNLPGAATTTGNGWDG
jgi:hypothetical protein